MRNEQRDARGVFVSAEHVNFDMPESVVRGVSAFSADSPFIGRIQSGHSGRGAGVKCLAFVLFRAGAEF